MKINRKVRFRNRKWYKDDFIYRKVLEVIRPKLRKLILNKLDLRKL